MLFLQLFYTFFKIGLFGFAEDRGQTAVRCKSWFWLSDSLLLQFCAEENAECQAEVRVLEVAAEQLRDVGEAVQQRRAVQVERRRCFGDGEVIIEINAQRLQIGDLRAFVVRLQLFQAIRVIDP